MNAKRLLLVLPQLLLGSGEPALSGADEVGAVGVGVQATVRQDADVEVETAAAVAHVRAV